MMKKFLSLILAAAMLGSTVGIPVYAENSDAAETQTEQYETEQYEVDDTVPTVEPTEEPAAEPTEEPTAVPTEVPAEPMEVPVEEETEENTEATVGLFSGDTVTYSIEKDQTYSFTNIGAISYDITGLSNYIDYVIYYKDGSVSSYDWNKKPSTLSVPSGGKAVITSIQKTINAVIADEYFIVEEQQNPVMAKTTAKVGETYTYTNTSNVAYNLLMTYASSSSYYFDYVIYDADGNVSAYEFNKRASYIEIPAEYSIKVTPTKYSMTFNGIYEKFDLVRSDTPVMKKAVVSVGETYTYTNTSNVAYNLLMTGSSGYYFDYVIYDADGNVSAYEFNKRASYIEIPAEYSIKVTPTKYSMTFNGIYEKFDLVRSDTPVMKKAVVSVGETYTYTNTSNVAYNLLMTGSSGYYFDYVIYDADGNVSAYEFNKRASYIEIPASYSIKVTPTNYSMTFNGIYEKFDLVRSDTPVMKKAVVSVGETYTYTNTSNVAYKVLTNNNDYNYVIYDADGNINSYDRYAPSSSYIEIPAGYSIKVTPYQYNTTFNGIYEKFSVEKNNIPVMKRTVVSAGEAYTYTNTSNVAYNLLCSSTTYSYVLYYSNGAVKETGDYGSYTMSIPAGGKIKVSPTSYSITFNGLYEIFDVTANTTLENYQTLSSDSTYIITNTDTVDNTLQFTTTSTSDYAIYAADGTLSEYKTRSSDDITIPKGGKAIITPNSLAMYSFVNTETVAVAERAKPVYNTTYINPGETYKYTNTASRELKVFKNGLSCDYVIYNADGSIDSYAANATDDYFTVPIGGSICITSRVYLNIKGLYDYFTVEKVDNSVFAIVFNGLNETYQFTNNAVKDINLILSGGVYDYIIYNADGSVSSEAMNVSNGTVTVPSGNKCVISPLVSNISIYALRDVFAFSKRSYPVMKRIPISYGESVMVTNTSNEDKTLYNKTGSYIDYVTYDAGENPQEAKELVTTSAITVPTGGKAVVTAKLSSACIGGLYEAFSNEDFTVKVTGITLSSNSLSLAVGKQSVLTATVLPSDATNNNITWTSSDSSVATVAQTGKVTAKAAGTATITATTADGGFTASCTVTVTAPAAENYPYEITSLSIETESGEVLTTAPTGQNFIVSAGLIEKQARNDKDYLFIAVYGADDTLLSMNYMKSDFVTNQEYNLGLNIQAQSKPIGSIKAFILSDFGGMEPLAVSKEL